MRAAVRTRFSRLIVICVATCLVAGGFGTTGFASQSGLSWSPPRRVEGYHYNTFAPLLLADKNRTVHAFATQLVQDTFPVVYRQWTARAGWTAPNDVVLPPAGRAARVLGVYIDDESVIHMAIYGGDDYQGDVFYTRVSAASAGDSRSWSKPVLIGDKAGPVSHGSVTGDGRGRLAVLYSGQRAGPGLFSVLSSDGGKTWSTPVSAFLTYNEQRWVSYIASMFDSAGRVHAVWSLSNTDGLSEAVHYARLDPGVARWSNPTALAYWSGLEATAASIVEHGAELLVVFQNGSPATKFTRRSGDGGKTWSEPVVAFEGFQGGNGPVVLLHDSQGTLHGIVGNRTMASGTEVRGMWHSVWDGGRWGPLQPVVAGPYRTSAQGDAFDPTIPQAVISQGNILLATWTTDTSFNGVWYAYANIGTPEIPVKMPSSPASSPVPARAIQKASPTATAAKGSSPGVPTRVLLSAGAGEKYAPPDSGAAPPWIISAVTVALLVSVTMIASLAAKNR